MEEEKQGAFPFTIHPAPPGPYFPTGEEETSEETSRGYHLEGSGRGLERRPRRGVQMQEIEKGVFFYTNENTHESAVRRVCTGENNMP